MSSLFENHQLQKLSETLQTTAAKKKATTTKNQIVPIGFSTMLRMWKVFLPSPPSLQIFVMRFFRLIVCKKKSAFIGE